MRHVSAVVISTDRYHPVDASRCANNDVDILLKKASEPKIEFDEFISLTRTIVAHMRDERFQRHLVRKGLISDFLGLISRTYSFNPFLDTSLQDTYPNSIPREPEDEAAISTCHDALIISLSDISATPEFARKHPVDSALFKTLCIWLSAREPSVQLCACLMIGNLARSDAVCKEMVHKIGLHELLVNILIKNDDLQLLHATLGFLRNLALRVENKGTIAGSNVLEPLSKIWTSSSRPQLQYEAVRVVRQLVNGSLANIQRLLMPLAWGQNAEEDCYLAQLLTLFEKSDDVSTRFEISRIVAAIWRCVRSPASTQYFSDIVEVTLPRLHSIATDLAKPLLAMVKQSRWPVVRSEGWFAMALMARSKDGSDAIVDLLSDTELSNALIEAIDSQRADKNGHVSVQPGDEISITGADTSELNPKQENSMETKDRDNALVLVSELLKNSVSTPSTSPHTASCCRITFGPYLSINMPFNGTVRLRFPFVSVRQKFLHAQFSFSFQDSQLLSHHIHFNLPTRLLPNPYLN